MTKSGPPLNFETGQILALRSTAMSLRVVAMEIGRCRDAITRFLKPPAVGQQKKRTAWNRKVTAGDRRLLLRGACKGKRSAAQSKVDLNLSVSVSYTANNSQLYVSGIRQNANGSSDEHSTSI